MHDLRIEGRKIFLDGFELKEVSGYELKADATSPHAEMTVKITVRDIEQPEWRKIGTSIPGKSTLVNVGDAGPEVIAPIEKLEEMLGKAFGTCGYWQQKQQKAMNKPPMTPGFIRVYHLKDGTQHAAEGRIFDTYGEAESMLWCFQPSGEEGTDDMLNVDHVMIEKRFYPVPFWRD